MHKPLPIPVGELRPPRFNRRDVLHEIDGTPPCLFGHPGEAVAVRPIIKRLRIAPAGFRTARSHGNVSANLQRLADCDPATKRLCFFYFRPSVTA